MTTGIDVVGKLQNGRCGQAAKFLGIDPGLTGALACYDGLKMTVYPVLSEKAKGRGRVVLWDEFCFMVQPVVDGAKVCYIEQVSTRPGEGRVSAFKFGYVSGGLRGLVAYAGVPVAMVTPQKWKKFFELPADKEAAVDHASSLFPEIAHTFRGPRGGIKDGLAEAALISYYGYLMENQDV